MRLAILLLLTTALGTTAHPTPNPNPNPDPDPNLDAKSPALQGRGSPVCGHAYAGYNTPTFSYVDLAGSRSCRALDGSVFLYSIEPGCRCALYNKAGCAERDKVVDRSGPLNAAFVEKPDGVRWYVCWGA